MAELDKVWRQQRLSHSTMLRIYTSLVQLVVLYGSETWTMRNVAYRRTHLHSRDVSRLNCLHEAIPIAPAASDFPFRLLVDAVTHAFSVFRVCKVP